MELKGPVQCSMCDRIIEVALPVTKSEYESYAKDRKIPSFYNKLAKHGWVLRNEILVCPDCQSSGTDGLRAGSALLVGKVFET